MPSGGRGEGTLSLRVETVLSGFAVIRLWGIREGVVGPIHERVLAKHGSHFDGLMMAFSW